MYKLTSIVIHHLFRYQQINNVIAYTRDAELFQVSVPDISTFMNKKLQALKC